MHAQRRARGAIRQRLPAGDGQRLAFAVLHPHLPRHTPISDSQARGRRRRRGGHLTRRRQLVPAGLLVLLVALRVLPFCFQRLRERTGPLPGRSRPGATLPAPVDVRVVRREPALPLHVGLRGRVLGAVLVRGLDGRPAAPAVLRSLDGAAGAVSFRALHVLLPAPARMPALWGEMRLLRRKAQGRAMRPDRGEGSGGGRVTRSGRAGLIVTGKGSTKTFIRETDVDLMSVNLRDNTNPPPPRPPQGRLLHSALSILYLDP